MTKKEEKQFEEAVEELEFEDDTDTEEEEEDF